MPCSRPHNTNVLLTLFSVSVPVYIPQTNHQIKKKTTKKELKKREKTPSDPFHWRIGSVATLCVGAIYLVSTTHTHLVTADHTHGAKSVDDTKTFDKSLFA